MSRTGSSAQGSPSDGRQAVEHVRADASDGTTWVYQDSMSGAQGHLELRTTTPLPDPLDAHREHLAHIDACGFCSAGGDTNGSMCHEGHQLWRKSRAARA